MKRLLIAAVAACALDSAAMANDLTFTWNYVGLQSDTPRSLCGDTWVGCVPATHDVSGTFTLTVPDDTFDQGEEVAGNDSSIDTISFHTLGGQLLFYKITNNLSLHELLVNTDGGMEETWIADPDGYVTSRTEIVIGAGLTPIGVFPVPEPAPALLLFGGLAVLAAYARRQPRRRSAL
jgi:hypothetical protein